MSSTSEAVREALNRAIEISGSQTALAAAIGPEIRTGHIFYWRTKGVVPAEHCPAIERATGVRCEDLCPGVQWAVLRPAES